VDQVAMQKHRLANDRGHFYPRTSRENVAAGSLIDVRDIHITIVLRRNPRKGRFKGRLHDHMTAFPDHKRACQGLIERHTDDKPVRLAQVAPLFRAFR